MSSPEKEHKWFIEQTSSGTAHMFAIKDYLVATGLRISRWDR